MGMGRGFVVSRAVELGGCWVMGRNYGLGSDEVLRFGVSVLVGALGRSWVLMV